MEMSESGLPVEPVYDAASLAGVRPGRGSGEPGQFPYTRGVYPTMYTKRPWTMRQYAGFSTAADSNRRYQQLISTAPPACRWPSTCPTQMGYDSDAPPRAARSARSAWRSTPSRTCGRCSHGIPLDAGVDVDDDQRARPRCCCCSTSWSRRSRARSPRSADRHDPERHPQGVHRPRHLHLPAAARRCGWWPTRSPTAASELPRWNTISISGYHMAEAGATPVQEIAFTLANAKEYVRTALAAGLAIDEFAPALVVLLRRQNHAP